MGRAPSVLSTAALVIWSLSRFAVLGFEVHPDHHTCEDHEIAITEDADLENWDHSKPLRCLWSPGYIQSPYVNGKDDWEHASCLIADFLSKLKFPEELRALKLYMNDIWVPCFAQYLESGKMHFPNLQILHMSAAMRNRVHHGDVWLLAQRMTNFAGLRELVISTYHLHPTFIEEAPNLHHLDVFGLEADKVYPDGPSLILQMLQKAPNVLNVHVGGGLVSPLTDDKRQEFSMKQIWQRCPADVCAGVTTLSLNSNKLAVIWQSEIAWIVKALPSLRTFWLGPQHRFLAEDSTHFANKLIDIAHPLPHFKFHLNDGCGYKYKGTKLYDKCVDGIAKMLTALPDLTDVTVNYDHGDIRMGEDFLELVDDGITVHNYTYAPQMHIFEWGGGPPHLYSPIEEHLSDVETEIRAPDAAVLSIKELHEHKSNAAGRSSNIPQPKPKQEWQHKMEARVADEMDKPWLHDAKHAATLQEFHGDGLDHRERVRKATMHGEQVHYNPENRRNRELGDL